MTILLSNLRLKLLAIFFAVALWSVVAYTSNPTQSKNYQLAIHPTVPSGLVIVGDVPPINVTVIGTADNLNKFDKSSLRVTGNFSNVKVGRNRVPIDVQNSDSSVNVVAPSSVQVEGPKSQLTGIQAAVLIDLGGRQAPGFTLPFTVTVLDANKKQLTKGFTVTPPQVTVKMVIQADAITVAKPVGWTLTGQPAAGYRVSNVQIAPLEVQASGLQTTLGNIVLLATDPIDVSGATADVVRTVTIRPPDGVSVNQKTAQVHVFIARAAGVSPSPGP